MADDARRESEVKSLGDVGIRSAKGRPQPAANSTPSSKNASTKLRSLAGQSEEVIYCATTIFRFRPERYELLIDRVKVTVIKRLLLLADNITSIALDDLLSVNLSSSLFFGTLTLRARYEDRPIVIPFLLRSKAFRAKRIMEGLIVAKNKGINLDEIPIDELTAEVTRIGTGVR